MIVYITTTGIVNLALWPVSNQHCLNLEEIKHTPLPNSAHTSTKGILFNFYVKQHLNESCEETQLDTTI